MFIEILKMLKQPVTLTTEEIAVNFGIDTQTVLAALEQLERMGYLYNSCLQRNTESNCKGCFGCSRCSLSNTSNASNIRVYSLQ